MIKVWSIHSWSISSIPIAHCKQYKLQELDFQVDSINERQGTVYFCCNNSLRKFRNFNRMALTSSMKVAQSHVSQQYPLSTTTSTISSHSSARLVAKVLVVWNSHWWNKGFNFFAFHWSFTSNQANVSFRWCNYTCFSLFECHNPVPCQGQFKPLRSIT